MTTATVPETDETARDPRAILLDHLRRVTPEGMTLWPYQVTGAAFLLGAGRAYLGDEQGTGKTIQALTAARAAGARRILVICKASLKANWLAEAHRWAPEYRAHAVSGVRPYDTRPFSLVIVNFDILGGEVQVEEGRRGKRRTYVPGGWAADLAEGGFDALIIDEAHTVKNPAARRTMALRFLASRIPAEGLVLALSGTAIVNRPIELLAQLEILGVTEQVVRAAERLGLDLPPEARNKTAATRFRYAFAWNPTDRWSQWNGHPNADLLNRALRSTIYVRRERSDVLGLAPTRRHVVPLSVNGDLSEYRAAEADFRRWLRDHFVDGAERAARAARAETITRLNLLRRLAEQAKIRAGVEWVEDWLEENETRHLVVFAEHREVQAALVEHFHAPHILAGEKNAPAQIAAWEAGPIRVLVCSLGAAKEGHNLQKASDVVFLGFGWTPGGLSQAEARVNRAGQEAAQTWAWQLTIPQTVDDDILSLIEAKRVVSHAVLVGDDEEGEEGMVAALISGVLGRGTE